MSQVHSKSLVARYQVARYQKCPSVARGVGCR